MIANPSADDLKAFHRQFITGVTVVTTREADGTPRGLVVNAFASVCLEPPVILVCVGKHAATFDRLFSSNFFAVNILSEDQEETAHIFARSGDEKKFSSVAWRDGEMSNVPIIDECCGYVEAEVEKRLQAYTHTIFLGRVLKAACEDAMPLAYWNGKFYRSSALKL